MSVYRYICVVMAVVLGSVVGFAAERSRNSRFEEYIQRHYREAIRQMERHSIPASIKMAQGLIETGAGRSSLATEHNNHFGIKCHKTWTGKKTYKTDDAPDECFRSYRSWEESYEDHSVFLKGRRYQKLFSLHYDDYKGWAKGLQQAGYATNKGYANLLIKVIEDYELYTLDQGKAPKWLRGGESTREKVREPRRRAEEKKSTGTHRPIYMSYGLLYVLADPNDSFERIGEELGISARKLAKYNDAPVDFTLQEGDIIYLERKARAADRKYSEHRIGIGDSMHSISQRYGIRLERLYKLNDLDEDYLPEEGDVLRLR